MSKFVEHCNNNNNDNNNTEINKVKYSLRERIVYAYINTKCAQHLKKSYSH